jgi:hypothetical protein
MDNTVYSLQGFCVETVQYFMALYTHIWPLLHVHVVNSRK